MALTKTSDLTAEVSSTVRTTIGNSLLPASLLPSVLTVKGLFFIRCAKVVLLSAASSCNMAVALLRPHCRLRAISESGNISLRVFVNLSAADKRQITVHEGCHQ